MLRLIRFVAAVCVLAIVAIPSALAGGAGRTVSLSYDGPNGVILDSVGSGGSIWTVQTGDVYPKASERYVSIQIADESGQSVAAHVHQGRRDLGLICGEGDEHLELVSAKGVFLHLQLGPSTECGTVSVPTSGTIDLTFHK